MPDDLVITVSGPSGSGKTMLLKRIQQALGVHYTFEMRHNPCVDEHTLIACHREPSREQSEP